MNVSNYIARRTIAPKGKSFSRFIVRLTTAAVILSVAIMIGSVCIISGFKHEISTKVFGVWGHINIADYNSQELAEIPFSDKADWMKQLEQLEQHSVEYKGETLGPIARIQKNAHIPGIIKGNKSFLGVICKGIDSSFYWNNFAQYIDSGSVDAFLNAKARPLLVSRTIKNKLKLKIGQSVIVYFIEKNKQIPRKFKLVASYHTGLEEYDTKLGFIPIQSLQKTVQWDSDQIGNLNIFLHDVDQMNQINEYIRYEILPPDMYAQTIEDKLYPIFLWLESQKMNERLINILMTIICIINMATGILILIFERSRMVGVLASLGYNHQKIQSIFIYYAWYILSRGLLIGNAIALGFAAFQYYTQALTLNEENYYIAYVPIKFEWGQIILINVFAAVTILLFMYLPSLFVRRLDPVKSLQFK